MKRAAISTLLLIMLLLLCLIDHSMEKAEGYSDFYTWENRSTRPDYPVGYDVNGTAVKQVIEWRGIRTVGGLSLKNGSIESMAPKNWTDNEMLPETYYTGDVYSGLDAPGILYGNQTTGLLYQYPFQSGTMYGRLIGFTTPEGRPINMAIRCLGYE